MRLLGTGGEVNLAELVEGKASKYGVDTSRLGKLARTLDGHTFASLAEKRRYQELLALRAAGRIRDLELQPFFPFVVNGVRVGHYRADFRYVDIASGETVVEDVKGARPKEWSRTRKLMLALYGIRVKEVRP